MAELGDVLVYLADEYPHKGELCEARTAKMVYLTDWRSALETGRQVTDVDWIFNHSGPHVDDIAAAARKTPGLEVVPTGTADGSPKEVIRRRGPMPDVDLTDDEKRIIDEVIQETESLYWDDFVKLVSSTYPVATQPRYKRLDLTALAREYAEVRARL